MLWRVAVLLTVGACATPRAGWRERVRDVTASADRCARFTAFDGEVQTAEQRAAREAGTEELLAASASLSTARRGCARARLVALLETRERLGPAAAQAELEGIARAFDASTFALLVDEALGPPSGDLAAMVAQAREAAEEGRRAQRDAAAHALLAANGIEHDRQFAPSHAELARGSSAHDAQFGADHAALGKVGAAHDAQLAPAHAALKSGAQARDARLDSDHAALSAAGAAHDEQFRAEHARLASEAAAHEAQARADGAVLSREAAARARAPGEASRPAAGGLEPLGAARDPDGALEPAGGAAAGERAGAAGGPAAAGQQGPVTPEAWPAARAALERRAASGHLEAAAVEGSAWAGVPEARPDVERWRAAARDKHLGLATEAGARANAARLHRLVAARFGGAPEVEVEAPGTWKLERWFCVRPKPASPRVPGGVEVRVAARCTVAEAPPRVRADGPQTFDEERSLIPIRYQVDATFTCGGKTFTRSLNRAVLPFDDEAGGGPTGGGLLSRRRLDEDLEQVVREGAAACRAVPAAATVSPDCAALERSPSLDVEEAFAAHRHASGAWAGCFVVAFTRRYGVPPP